MPRYRLIRVHSVNCQVLTASLFRQCYTDLNEGKTCNSSDSAIVYSSDRVFDLFIHESYSL